MVPFKSAFSPLEYWKVENSTDTIRPFRLKVRLKDPGGTKNYYRMSIHPANYNANTNRYSINRNSNLLFSIDNFTADGGVFGAFGDNLEQENFFTDETFDGREITLTIGVGKMNSERIYIAPQISQLSKSAYLYFESKRRQEDSDGNPFAEAVVVYNNIANGFGIVGGVADSVTIIKRRN